MSAVLRGWLLAWTIASAVPVGALVLLLVHRITGGRWGEALAPVLRPAALCLPLAALAFLPVMLGLGAIYSWAAGGAVAARPDVARYYLEPLLFDLRATVTLAGWSALAVLIATGRCNRLAAGLGLAFFGLTISLAAVDWILSLAPHYVSSAFAAGIAVESMLAALAFAAVVSPGRLGAQDASDLATLMLATLSGTVYIALMAFIVAWYGDLPAKAAWYLRRGETPWLAVILTGLIGGAVIPFGLMLLGAVRRSRAALRPVGLLLLLGVALHRAWLILPAFEDASEAAFVGVGALALMGVLGLPLARILSERLSARPGHA